MASLSMDKQDVQPSRSRNDEREFANVVHIPTLDDEGRVVLVDGHEGICLDGLHIMAKLFPGTLGRVAPFNVDQLDTDCEYCTAEGKTAHSRAA